MFKEWRETRLVRKKKASPLGLPQRDPSLPHQYTRGLYSSREPWQISSVTEKGRGERRMGGRGRRMMNGLYGTSTSSSLPSMWSPSTFLSEFRLDFQWEGLRITNAPKKIFCSSNSIGQPHRDLEPRVLTGTESPDPQLPWVPSAAMKGKDLDAQLCDCRLISAQLCPGSAVVTLHGAQGLTHSWRDMF